MSPKENSSEKLFERKPYLREYFAQSRGSGGYTISRSKKENEPYLNHSGKALASSISPKTQAERAIQSQNIRETDLVVLLGIGNPALWKSLNSQMEPGQILLLIDRDIEPIGLLWEEGLREVMEIPGRHLFCGDFGMGIIWSYLESLPVERLSGIRVFRNPGSLQMDAGFYRELETRLQGVLSSRMSDLLTKFEFEKLWVKNSFCNLSTFTEWPPRHKMSELEGILDKTPSVLVSAGPSLRSHCNFLRSVRSKVFVLSCDTSLKVLLAEGIVPDAVVTLDAQTHSFFHFMGANCTQIPLFADLVSSPQILRSVPFLSIVHSITARYIFKADGSQKREVTAGSETAEKLIGNIGGIQSGGSVATTAFDILRFLGSRPVFLLGQDLAYSGREIHSTGTHHNEKWLTLLNRKETLESINEKIIQKRDLRKVKSVTGGEVLTDYVLDLYRSWFEESAMAVEFPIYNVNDQGAWMENCQNLISKSAAEILSGYPDHQSFWKKHTVWSQNEFPWQENSFVEGFRKDLTLVLENLSQFAFSAKERSEYEDLVAEVTEICGPVPDLRFLFRKTEIYISRHRETLGSEKKSELYLQAIRKEVSDLKRKWHTYGNPV